jgi:outer membrane protein W
MATITYGLFDRLNVFARLGLADGGKWLDYQPGNNWKGELESNFVWAVGAKFAAIQLDNGFGMNLAGQYLRYDDRSVEDWRSEETGQSASQLGWNTDDNIDYWQADFVLTAQWAFGAFTPYVGAGYSYYNVNYKGQWTHQDPRIGWIKYDSTFENDQNFSGLVGFDVDLGEHFKINAQGTFISRTAVSLGLSWTF